MGITAATARILLPVLALLASAPAAGTAGAVLKCSTPTTEPLIWLDGEILHHATVAAATADRSDAVPPVATDSASSDAMASAIARKVAPQSAALFSKQIRLTLKDGREIAIDRSEIWSIEVACINPVDGTFTFNGDGVGVIVILTKSGVASLTGAALAQLVGAQSAHLAEHGSYAATISALELRPIHPSLAVSMDLRGDGWAATATLGLYQCFMFDGDIDPPRSDVYPQVPYCAWLPRKGDRP